MTIMVVQKNAGFVVVEVLVSGTKGLLRVRVRVSVVRHEGTSSFCSILLCRFQDKPTF